MISSDRSDPIRRLGRWLSSLPYENLSKRSASGPRTPSEVLEGFKQSGLGGTCFSLVRLAYERARDWNLNPAYYLGDRPTGENRHCVLGFPDRGVFLDPGYLTFEPVPLRPERTLTIVRSFNTLVLRPEPPGRLRIETRRKGQDTWRFTLKSQPVSAERFQAVWRASFGWDPVMESRVMTRRTDSGMLVYLNGRLEHITREERTRLSVPENRSAGRFLSERFGMDAGWLRKRLGPETVRAE